MATEIETVPLLGFGIEACSPFDTGVKLKEEKTAIRRRITLIGDGQLYSF